MKLVDLEDFKFDLSGLAYILPTDMLGIGEYFMRQLKNLPSVQPEIIRCKDCKYRDENWRRVSVRWLPCMDVRTGSNWYCGSAERGEKHE